MKELVGLLIFICITAITMYLGTQKRVTTGLATVFFGVAIVGGLAAANYDVVKRWKLSREGLEIEKYEQEVNRINAEWLAKFEEEVASHSESLNVLTRDINRTAEEIEDTYSVTRSVALIMAKLTWWQMSTKGDFGGPRADKAVELSMAELNPLLELLIPDEAKRKEWIEELQNSLPARQ